MAEDSLRQVFVNKHWLLEQGTSRRLLVARRTDRPYVHVADIATSFAALEQVLNGYDRKHFSLLIDMRAAPPRNDPEFEKAASNQADALSHGFMRVAVLVRTASGLLQMTRHVRARGTPMEPFVDEDKALEYLFSPLSSARGTDVHRRRRP